MDVMEDGCLWWMKDGWLWLSGWMTGKRRMVSFGGKVSGDW